MRKVVSRCPVCGNELIAVRLKCESCDTVIENSFRLSRFDYLSDEDLAFVETFLRCSGRLNDVQRALGLSYPTVRSRLDTCLKRLGLSDPRQAEDRTARREAVLTALEKGELTAEQALEQLK